MKQTAYGKPLFLNSERQVTSLNKLETFDEGTIQKLIFERPECLPISDIDESYNPVIPVCMELNTTVGPLDILMVSPNGELTIVETKLWRNPEARRKVIAQILDYAKELSGWSYEDLQREVNKRLGEKGNTLYKLVTDFDSSSALPESDFVDSVNRNLERGRFLLLIAGDGIREGARGITEFLSGAGQLNFSFAMVELNIYEAEKVGTLVIPKTLVKTTEIGKMTVEVPTGFKLTIDDTIEKSNPNPSVSKEWEKEKAFYTEFWNELVNDEEFKFDDPGQSMPKPAAGHNLYVYPAGNKKAWISAYFAKSMNCVGVYFRTANNQEGKEILEALNSEKQHIREELGEDVIWTWDDKGYIEARLSCENIFDEKNREEIKDFFKLWLNNFVNALRPRLKKVM
ncbi:MAG: DUF4268 domain-containing protein [Flavobacteriales bacterium]|nr:DUF4268 domain-containing protein [Flavobacteriales bacterium]